PLFRSNIAHASPHRQADESLVSRLGHRPLSFAVTQPLIIRMPRDWYVMHVDADVLRAQRPEDFRPARTKELEIQPYRVEMPGMIPVRWNNRNIHFRHGREDFCIPGGNR